MNLLEENIRVHLGLGNGLLDMAPKPKKEEKLDRQN